jgi:CubicO group peptidase (beta-lactamase class C family)
MSLQTWLENQIKSNQYVTGINMCIFDKDGILKTAYTGVRDIDTKSKLQLDDKFNFASNGKSVLCLAVTTLIADKKIPNVWEETLGSLLPEFEMHNDYENVKLKYFATHSGGVSDTIYGTDKYKYLTDKLSKNPIEHRKEFVKKLLRLHPSYKPETKFEYSNQGYCVIAVVLETIINKTASFFNRRSYEDVIRQTVFDKMDMASAGFGRPESNITCAHYRSPYFYKVLDYDDHPNPMYEQPSGNMYCNIKDFAKYAQCHLKGLIDNNDVFKFLHKPVGVEPISNYAYGWDVYDGRHTHSGAHTIMSTRALPHGAHTTMSTRALLHGTFPCMSSYMCIIPEENIGVVFMSNCDGSDLEGLADNLLDNDKYRELCQESKKLKHVVKKEVQEDTVLNTLKGIFGW